MINLFDFIQTVVEYMPLISGAYILILIMRFPDLTIEASWSLGGIFSCLVMVGNIWLPELLVPMLGGVVGALCGLLTAIIFFAIGRSKLLAGLISYLILESIGARLLGQNATIYLPVSMVKFGCGDKYLPVVIYLIYALGVLFFVWWWQRSTMGIKMRIIGEKPKSYYFFDISLDATFFIGLITANALIGIGGGLYSIYYGSATNLQGIGLVLKAFAVLLLGDELLKLFKKAKRPEPIVIIVGLVIYILITYLADYGIMSSQLLSVIDVDSIGVKSTDKQFFIAFTLIFLLAKNKASKKSKEVSEW